MSANLDLTIEQGSTFSIDIAVINSSGSAIDLAGYTARMSIKRSAAESAALIELTTENGNIMIDSAAGLVHLYLSNTVTAALNFTWGVYDLELISAGAVVTRLCEGSISVSKNVTV